MLENTWMHGEGPSLADDIKGEDIYRLIPSRYPSISVFENILDPEELEAAYELESLTNDRLRDEVGDISLVSPEDRVVGPGASVIMAAFTHAGVESRFTGGDYGVFYGGVGLETAISESRSSQERFLSATDHGACEITMRCYKVKVCESLLDVRGDDYDHLYDKDDWSVPQSFGAGFRTSGEWGLWYRSVRNPGGECVAVFRPKAIEPPAIQCAHYRYCWDGEKITNVFKVESGLE